MTVQGSRSVQAQAVFKFITDFKAAHDGNSPTIREICDGLGTSSTSDIHRSLLGLRAEGLIEFMGTGKSRGILVVGGAWNAPARQS